MAQCLLMRSGGGKADLILCSADVNQLTRTLTTWKESNASVTVNAHNVVVNKTSDSNGGSGINTAWAVDVTNYSTLRIEIELTSIRNTTNDNYIPMIGIAVSKQTALASASAVKMNLVAGGTTSLARCVKELDITQATGEHFICYKGIASGTIYDFRLIK